MALLMKARKLQSHYKTSSNNWVVTSYGLIFQMLDSECLYDPGCFLQTWISWLYPWEEFDGRHSLSGTALCQPCCWNSAGFGPIHLGFCSWLLQDRGSTFHSAHFSQVRFSISPTCQCLHFKKKLGKLGSSVSGIMLDMDDVWLYCCIMFVFYHLTYQYLLSFK